MYVRYSQERIQNFCSRGGGGVTKIILKTHKTFAYIHFCYVFMTRSNISGRGSNPITPAQPLDTALDRVFCIFLLNNRL